MYDTQLYFYLIKLNIKDFNLINFKQEILLLFSNENPLYYFDITITYNIYIFGPEGNILCKLPFKLYSLGDKEDVIEDAYNMLLESLKDYLSSLEVDKYPLDI